MRGASSTTGSSDLDVGLLIGIPFAGFLFGGFLVSLRKRKAAQATQLEEFHERMMRLGIQPEEIIANMPQSLLQNRKIYALIKPMMHGSY